MSDDLRARLAAVLSDTPASFLPAGAESPCGVHALGEGLPGHDYHGGCALCRGEIDTLVDAIMSVVRPSREGHQPYCEGGHGDVVTCVQVATWRRDSARDPWRCWHNPYPGGWSRHSFGDGDVCRFEGCGQRLSELKAADHD